MHGSILSPYSWPHFFFSFFQLPLDLDHTFITHIPTSICYKEASLCPAPANILLFCHSLLLPSHTNTLSRRLPVCSLDDMAETHFPIFLFILNTHASFICIFSTLSSSQSVIRVLRSPPIFIIDHFDLPHLYLIHSIFSPDPISLYDQINIFPHSPHQHLLYLLFTTLHVTTTVHAAVEWGCVKEELYIV